MNTTQRDAINSGTFANSLLIFNTTDNCLQIYNDNSSTWENIHCFLNCSTAPAQPGVITGNSAPTQNETGVTYSIAQVAGATSYNWSVPTGASITAGQGTTGILVDWGTTGGNISVTASNSLWSKCIRNISNNRYIMRWSYHFYLSRSFGYLWSG